MKDLTTEQDRKPRNADRRHPFLSAGAFGILTACDLRIHKPRNSFGTRTRSSPRCYIGAVD